MYARRRFSSGRRTFGGFRRRVPLARKQRYWIQTQDSGVSEVAGTPTYLSVLSWADVPGLGTMAALSKGVRLLRTLIIITSNTDDVIQSRVYGVVKDDASDSVPANRWDPSGTTAANQRIPGRVFRWGGLLTMPTANPLVPAVFYQNLDGTRDIKLGGYMKPDEVIAVLVSPAAAAADQLTFTIRSRTLIEIG